MRISRPLLLQRLSFKSWKRSLNAGCSDSPPIHTHSTHWKQFSWCIWVCWPPTQGNVPHVCRPCPWQLRLSANCRAQNSFHSISTVLALSQEVVYDPLYFGDKTHKSKCWMACDSVVCACNVSRNHASSTGKQTQPLATSPRHP